MTTPASNWRARVAAPSFPPVAGVHRMTPFATTLAAVIDAGQDFEWYPTTSRMIGEVARRLSRRVRSVMDIGAGDGRVLLALAKVAEDPPELFAIEKSHVLLQAQPQKITPVGVDFHEQNLSACRSTYIFSNPPYSEFEVWATRIIETAFAERAYLVLPRRWKESAADRRGARDAQGDGARHLLRHVRTRRRPACARGRRHRRSHVPDEATTTGEPVDPFDQWFDQNISTFDTGDDARRGRRRRRHGARAWPDDDRELVDAYNEDYARMEENYRAIFKLDYAILKELGVNERGGPRRPQEADGRLKTQYWQLLFEKLDAITSRLSTKTKALFLDRLTGRSRRRVHLRQRLRDRDVGDQEREPLLRSAGRRSVPAAGDVRRRRELQEQREDVGEAGRLALQQRGALPLRARLSDRDLERHAAIFTRGFGRYDYPRRSA
jgi:hypothetical protein